MKNGTKTKLTSMNTVHMYALTNTLFLHVQSLTHH
jgi:hypothetical protein